MKLLKKSIGYYGLLLIIFSLIFNGCATTTFKTQENQEVEITLAPNEDLFNVLSQFEGTKKKEAIEFYTDKANKIVAEFKHLMVNENLPYHQAKVKVYEAFRSTTIGNSDLSLFNITVTTSNVNHTSSS